MVSSGRSRSCGDRCGHPHLRSQRCAALAGAVDGFGDEGVGCGFLRLDNHVPRLGDRDLELVGFNRRQRQAVGRNNRHRQAGNANVEIAHRGGIDDPQPHPLAGFENAGPVAHAVMAVDEIVIISAGHIGDVGRVHQHLAPHDTLGQWLVLAFQQARPSSACAY